MSLDVLSNARFFGNDGPKTLFAIECHSGKNIRKHSLYPDEQEVLLPPGCQFEITGSLKRDNNLHIIYLKEIKPKYPLIKLVQPPSRISQNTETSVASAEEKTDLSARVQRTPWYTQPNLSAEEYLPRNNRPIDRSPSVQSKSIILTAAFYLRPPAQQSETQAIHQVIVLHTTVQNIPVVPTCNNSWLQKYIDDLYSNPVISLLYNLSLVNSKKEICCL